MNSLQTIIDDLLARKDEQFHAIAAGVTNSKRTQFSSVKGVVSLPDGTPANEDSSLHMFSCTKTMTSMAILILMEQGKLKMSDPAKKYLPRLADFYIVSDEDVDDKTGEITGKRQPPETDITIEHLLLHTAGFGYPFTAMAYLKIMTKRRVFAGEPMETLFVPSAMPLVHEPGANFTYGYSTDWLGLIVEAISGKSLSAFLKENIFDKASMANSVFVIDDSSNLIKVHTQDKNGDMRPEKRSSIPYKPKIDMGGQGCTSTVGDFMKFLRIWLNYGTSPDTGIKILDRSTVEYAIKNRLSPDLDMQVVLGLKPDVDDPKPEGFSFAGCAVNTNELSTGRPAGSLYWGGLANSFFWIDFKNDIAGFFGFQRLPFMEDACVDAYRQFETETYRLLTGSKSRL